MCAKKKENIAVSFLQNVAHIRGLGLGNMYSFMYIDVISHEHCYCYITSQMDLCLDFYYFCFAMLFS